MRCGNKQVMCEILIRHKENFFFAGGCSQVLKTEPPSLERFKTQLDKALSSDVAGPALSSG